MSNNNKQVVKTLQKVYLNDFYLKVDVNLKVELAVLELMARYDLTDANTYEYRLAQIKSSFNNEWKDYEGIEKMLLHIIINMSSDTNYRKNKNTLNQVSSYLKLSSNDANRVFNYETWVRNKFGV